MTSSSCPLPRTRTPPHPVGGCCSSTLVSWLTRATCTTQQKYIVRNLGNDDMSCPIRSLTRKEIRSKFATRAVLRPAVFSRLPPGVKCKTPTNNLQRALIMQVYIRSGPFRVRCSGNTQSMVSQVGVRRARGGRPRSRGHERGKGTPASSKGSAEVEPSRRTQASSSRHTQVAWPPRFPLAFGLPGRPTHMPRTVTHTVLGQRSLLCFVAELYSSLSLFMSVARHGTIPENTVLPVRIIRTQVYSGSVVPASICFVRRTKLTRRLVQYRSHNLYLLSMAFRLLHCCVSGNLVFLSGSIQMVVRPVRPHGKEQEHSRLGVLPASVTVVRRRIKVRITLACLVSSTSKPGKC